MTIDAPPHVVFAILADPGQHPRIDGSGSVQQVTTGPERRDGRAVAHAKEAHLRSIEEVLDHDSSTRGQNRRTVRDRLLTVARHDDSLASGKAIVLDDVRCPELVQGRRKLAFRAAHPGVRRRHSRRRHDLLGKRLRAFEHRRGPRRPEDRNVHGSNHIGDARELLHQKKHRAAWDSTCAAIAVRPFHPEGWLLLGQIAADAGDTKLAARCVDQVKALAPQWKPGKELAKALQKRSSKKTLDWPLPAVSAK